ncbi:MAG: 3-dehydroquinate synthase [Candidatus Acidiferrales bacterium]
MLHFSARTGAMQTIHAKTAANEYLIHCGEEAISGAGAFLSNLDNVTGIYLLSSPVVWKIWGRAIAKGLAPYKPAKPILFDDRERSKRIGAVEKICRSLTLAGADRCAVLVAMGGGVVGDVAGFVAASYLRGVRIVHVPTTVVAQVDSSIGGKTGVDLPEGKNLVGAFHQPQMVLADPQTLRTLPPRQYRSGIFEVIKYGVIGDAGIFNFLEGRMEGLLRQDPAALEWVLPNCMRMKTEIVSKDERDTGLRETLNFGHTTGHGLEAATNFRRFLHGEAVGWGMLAATEIAREMGRIEVAEALRISRLIWRAGPLPSLAGVSPAKVLRAMRTDKKSRAGRLRWVLPRRVGEVDIGVDVPHALVRKVLGRLPQILRNARGGS